MKCPRCDSKRIQLDYDDAFALAHLAGMRKVLCNHCGHVFHGFDPLGRLRRAPSKARAQTKVHRRSPRYRTHLPTSISLLYDTAIDGRAEYSPASQGHCDSISRTGMGLSLVGSRFDERDLTQMGRLLFVRVQLPEATIEAVVSIVNTERIGEGKKRKWHLGVKVQQISDEHKELLKAYLTKRQEGEPLIISE
jgi:PilZ domain